MSTCGSEQMEGILISPIQDHRTLRLAPHRPPFPELRLYVVTG